MQLRWIALIVLVTSAARADHLTATRQMPLYEVSHTVDVRIERGVATYVVQRQFRNTGKQAEEVRLQINLPDGAAATGLRIRANKTWYAAELLDADVAAARYENLTGQGVGEPKDPALLYWSSSSALSLQVFPVLPSTTSTIEYTLVVPTKYEAGRYLINYPRAELHADAEAPSLALAAPVITVQTREPYLLDGKRVAAGTRSTLRALTGDDPDELAGVHEAQLSIAPDAIAVWSGRLGRAVASNQHAFARFELDVAPRLTQLPKRAQVVFAIDASYSAGDELVETQLDIARAYASHVPDAQIELVVYRRTAKRVFGTFVPATQLPARIATAARAGAFTLGNGSALDEAARLASTALAARPGPRRLVLLTDTLVRSALTPEAAGAALQLDRDTIVHVVVPQSKGAGLERDDTHDLAPLATKHHGIFATVRAETALKQHALELVRPVRIDNVVSNSPAIVVEATLAEGAGVRWFEDLEEPGAPKQAALTGMLWSDPVKLDVSVDPAFSQATAAFVFGATMHSSLSAAEQKTIAFAGRAVSPVTSYLAIEPGVRPSKVGIDRALFGTAGWGTIGTGHYGTVGHGVRGRRPPDLHSLVDTTVCLAKHVPPAGWEVELVVETTKAEIADVEISSPASPLATCLAETVWAVRLDGRFDVDLETFHLTLH